MKNNSRKFFDKLVSRTKFYLVIILILLIIICIKDTRWILPLAFVYVLVVAYAVFADNKRKNELSESLKDLTMTVDTAAKTSLINSPFPLVILETNGKIIWRSSKFVSEFANIDIQNYLNDLIYDIKQEIERKKDGTDKSVILQTEIGNRTYKVFGRFVNSKKSNNTDYTIILYFIDETENIKLQKEYTDSKSCVEIIMIDNYEENMQLIDGEEKPQITAEIDKCIFDWTNETNGILIKSDRDTYIYIFEQRYLEQVKQDKFSILDKIKEIKTKENVQFTLSIAVSNEGVTDKEKYKSAQIAMDIILGRGGDQAVIRENEIYKFFGGRAQEVEKRTKVKARVVAHALENLIKESNKVMIMGHTNPDIDAMGSAMGIYRLVKDLGKNAYIVTSNETTTLQNFKESLMEEPEYEDILINKEVAEENMDEETLLRRKILDTANKSYNQNIYTYTGFLGLSELAIYNSMKKELQFAYPSTFGGSESSERQIIRFGSPEIFGYDDSFPISVLKISPLTPKFAQELEHRDYLGAIMNLGIERSLIGDILIKEKRYFYVLFLLLNILGLRRL